MITTIGKNVGAASPRRLRGFARRSFAAFLLIGVLALIGGADVAYPVTSFNWVTDVTMYNQSAVGTVGFAQRNYIEVWRPIGDDAYVFYRDTDNSIVSYSHNTTANPYLWSVSNSYGRAFCGTNTFVDVSPFTCQTTTP